MLNFNDYNNVLEDLKDEIEIQERKIIYREIELLGHRRNLQSCMSITAINISASSSDNQDDARIINSDVEYQRLNYHLQELRDRLKFIETYGNYPSEKMAEGKVFD